MLPVMNYRNQSISQGEVTSFDVNKAIQRSLTKALARHGLGLYIYAGEDLPNVESSLNEEKDTKKTDVKEKPTQRPKTVKGLDGKMKPIITEETFKKIVSEVKKDEAGLKEIVNATRQDRKVSEITEEEGRGLLDLIATTKKQRNVEDEKLEF